MAIDRSEAANRTRYLASLSKLSDCRTKSGSPDQRPQSPPATPADTTSMLAWNWITL
jgi:hypothetical protein